MEEIDAEVIEFVSLTDPDAQRVFAERRAFEQATGLLRVEAGRPGSLPRIEAAIRRSAGGGEDVGLAARRWYARTYRPLVRRIRRLGLAALFPGERSADLVARLADLREATGDSEGRRPSWEEALDRLAPNQGVAPAAPHRLGTFGLDAAGRATGQPAACAATAPRG